MAAIPIKTGILTVSDRCSQGVTVDESGENLKRLINSHKLFPGFVTIQECIPDDIDEIQEKLKRWEAELNLHLILTVGGTGFTSRDVTPEATSKVINRFAPAISTAITIASLQKTAMAMLSRAVCGIRKNTLIINLPGSKKASEECLEAVAPVLSHAIDQLQGRLDEVNSLHGRMKSHCDCSTIVEVIPMTKEQESKLRVLAARPLTITGAHDITRVAHRPRHSPYPMISVERAQEVVLGQCEQMPSVLMNFQHSSGYTTAQSVTANASLPPFPASIKDGYAVIASDGKGPRKVIGACNAGPYASDVIVTSGTCARISTGAPIPQGADAVVQVEDTKLLAEDDHGNCEVEIDILTTPNVGKDIRPKGSDFGKGEILIKESTIIGSTELGVMASAGVNTVEVYNRPVTTVFSTGNEVMEPGQKLEFGCIWDSNRITLLAMLKENGFAALDGGIAHDTEESVKSQFEEAFAQGEVVISTGGVSMGEKDLLKNVLEKHFEATIHFAQVFMKPGKPTTFATCIYQGEKKLVFALPGNPASSAVTFHLYVLPTLRKMAGQKQLYPNTIHTKVSHNIRLDPRPEYHRAIVKWDKEATIPIATSTGNQISSRLASMNSANALLVLPSATEERTSVKEGEIVPAILIGHL